MRRFEDTWNEQQPQEIQLGRGTRSQPHRSSTLAEH